MANRRPEHVRQEDRAKVLLSAARLFLETGYDNTSVRQIAAQAGVNVNTMVHDFGCKENILCELVTYVLKGQFSAAKAMLVGVTEDPLLYYAAETALQLYMAEESEAVRDLYCAAYSLSAASELIQRAVTERLTGRVFQKYLPDYGFDDFYQLEIASGSVIRGYMTVRCSETFPMEQKVNRFLESSLRIYRVPEDKIQEAKAFVRQFDYPDIARRTIHDMLAFLEQAAQT